MRKTSQLIAVLFLSLALLISAMPAWSQEPTRGPVPSWAILHPVPEKAPIDPALLMGGFHYLLIDVQRNLPEEQGFFHYAIRVINGDGIQSMSDIDVNFDPSYQTLQFNMVRLHRNGRTIDNLHNHEIKTFQRESGMDRNLLDGSLTAVINQENVRIGDIIEYAYTLTGRNPIHEGNYYDNQYQQFTIPIQQYNNRLITRDNRTLHFEYSNEAVEPEIQHRNSLLEYSWVFKNVPAHVYSDNTPIWYNPLPLVKISSFDQWAQVVQWALPHYSINPEDSAALLKLKDQLTPGGDQDSRILKAIRFVQDEVRYLGMEGGLGAYLPNQPLLVYQRRFGDCKDKSLLLTALLRNLGVDAHPVLIDTDYQERVTDKIPSAVAFNHCIVKFTHEGRAIFVDPTISNQGGDLQHLDVLPYGKGLVIAGGITELEDLPLSIASSVVVNYLFILEELGGPATMNITTTYGGLRADSQRDNFLANSPEIIGQASLDYYSNAYPGITELAPLNVIDVNRDNTNLVSVEESFLIEDLWTVSEADSNLMTVEITPMEMLDVADVAASAERSAPYGTGSLMDLKVNIVMMMPTDWPVSEQKVEIKSDAFVYNSELKGKGNRVESNFRYQRLKKSISAEDTKTYLADHDRIWDDLFLNISHNANGDKFQFSWFVGALALMILVLAIFAARNINRNYDPVPSVTAAEPKAIGGWLILPAIGLMVRPLVSLWSLVGDPTYFDHSTWMAVIQNDNYSSFSGLGFMLGYEILFGILEIVFSVLVLIQFFKKRSSVPRLAIILFLSALVITLVDLVLGYSFLSSSEMNEYIKEEMRTLRGVLTAVLIWVPYFLKSSRVKQTFIIQRQPAAIPASTKLPIGDQPEIQAPAVPKPSEPSGLPGPMIFSAILMGLSLLIGLGLIFGTGGFSPTPDAPAGSSEAAGQFTGTIISYILLLGVPILGLFSIFKRRTWARKFHIIFFILGIILLLVVGIDAYLDDPEDDAFINLIMLVVSITPLAIAVLFLVIDRASKNFPHEQPHSPDGNNGLWDYSTQCRSQARELFGSIQDRYPALRMTIQDSDPQQPLNMVIPIQPGIPRCIFMDLQKNDALNLSIGPAWMIWKSCNNQSVRHEFQATVQGILEGNYKFLEYLKGDELRVARIQNLQDNRWVEVRSWSKNRWMTTSGLEELVVTFGPVEKRVPNED